MLEDPDANPFLPGFYQDRARYALPTQLFFLFQRATQVRALSQPDLFARLTVADFMIDKDLLFARLTLSDDEFSLYQKVYAQLQSAGAGAGPGDLPAGDARDAGRARDAAAASPMSAASRTSTCVRLAESYARFFHQYDAAPVLIVNSEHLNFVDKPADFDLLLQRIAAMRGPREFFSMGN